MSPKPADPPPPPKDMLSIGNECYSVKCVSSKAQLVLDDVKSDTTTDPGVLADVRQSDKDGSSRITKNELVLNSSPKTIAIELEADCTSRGYNIDLVANAGGHEFTAHIQNECAKRFWR